MKLETHVLTVVIDDDGEKRYFLPDEGEEWLVFTTEQVEQKFQERINVFDKLKGEEITGIVEAIEKIHTTELDAMQVSIDHFYEESRRKVADIVKLRDERDFFKRSRNSYRSKLKGLKK